LSLSDMHPPPTATHTLPLHDALPIYRAEQVHARLLLAELLRAFLPRQPECPARVVGQELPPLVEDRLDLRAVPGLLARHQVDVEDRKSTRLNSSHVSISYAVFCLKKK